MSQKHCISVHFFSEKLVGHGEDAPPLLLKKEKAYAVGVFDGMGGAGAATCQSSFGEGYTKAYVASRIVESAVYSFLEKELGEKDISPQELKECIQKALEEELSKYHIESKSMLRSRLVRDYPTTMALVTLSDKDASRIVDSYWAGDSHCYLWTKSGFYLISKDDLEEDNDPMENLHNDSPISNCICADREFQINHIQISPQKDEPVVILTATDGCFGYYPTPMHFEHIIKKCLNNAKDGQDWGWRIEEQIQKVTGDDASLSLIALGFSSFDSLRGWANRSSKGMNKLIAHEVEIANVKKQLEQKTIEHKRLVDCYWDSYKDQHMKYINNKDNANA